MIIEEKFHSFKNSTEFHGFRIILKLQSGDDLFYEGKYLQAKIGFARQTVAILSKHAQDNLRMLIEKGYNVTSAKVRFIVAWKNQKNEGKESYIVLPEIYLSKKQIKRPNNH